METTVQALLVIMVLLLGTTLTIIGIQVFFILKEIRQNIQKFNIILDNFYKISNGIASGADQVGQLVENLKGTLTLVNIGKKIWDLVARKSHPTDPEDSTDED